MHKRQQPESAIVRFHSDLRERFRREQHDISRIRRNEQPSEHEEQECGREQQAGGGVETSEAKLWARESKYISRRRRAGSCSSYLDTLCM